MSDGYRSDGYRAREEGIRALARKMSQCAADLEYTDTALRSRGAGSADELGEQASAAFGAFFDAWSTETAVIGDALRELSAKLVASAAAYTSVDEATGDGFGQLTPSPGRVA